MSATERRAAFSLAGIFSFRMMGLFMILPVFALYAETLGEGRPSALLIGLAIGVYGLTQALFQIPFGILSDRYGRKPVITAGLLIFALGSVIAAGADTITGVIIGRALQGSGAIAAAVMALAADLTREEHRTKVMAIIGSSIGLSFAVALAAGPLLNHWIGVDGIFWLTAVLAGCGILVVRFAVPDPKRSMLHRDAEAVPAYFLEVLRNRQLLRLDFGIFTLHLMLTASFVGLPFALRDYAGFAPSIHGWVYLPVLVAALILMVPLVIVAERQRRIRQIYLVAICGIGAAELGLMLFYQSAVGIVAALLLFFVAFNLLEALLPSMIVKFAPAEKKGTAMGVYSTSQFLGAFCGGVLGGALFDHAGLVGLFGACVVLAAIWFLWARTMAEPRYLSSYMLHLGALGPERAATVRSELLKIQGVAEVVVVPEEGSAYLKVDSRRVDYQRLDAFSDYSDNSVAGEGVAGPVA